jgi:hypothetical protein
MLIKLQTSLMLSFTFALFIEISSLIERTKTLAHLSLTNIKTFCTIKTEEDFLVENLSRHQRPIGKLEAFNIDHLKDQGPVLKIFSLL